MNIPYPIDSTDVASAFPEYVILPEPLGHGGMKTAFHITSPDSVVLKVVREPLPEAADEGAVSLPERVKREIEGMGRISHPGIVQILTGPKTRRIDGHLRIWYVEPFYAGGTLERRLGHPWPEARCLRLLRDLCAAAEALSESGIVHRDIKPDNIAFDSDGNAVLLDLGIAFFRDLTALTNAWGPSPMTQRYAAPEQFVSRRHTSIDFRTDLFLVGMVIFEALTGEHAFRADEPEGYFERLMTGEISASHLEEAEASSQMKRIVRRLLQPSTSRRYRTFKQLNTAIGECK